MYNYPDNTGHFGIYGGRFASETLIPALDELKDAYHNIVPTIAFQDEYAYELKHFVGRPSPIYHAKRLSSENGDVLADSVGGQCISCGLTEYYCRAAHTA